MKTKSYNPFKMWGSWLGLVSGYLLGFVFIMAMQPETASIIELNFLRSQVITIPFGLVGFLLGWAIHSLIRRLKN